MANHILAILEQLIVLIGTKRSGLRGHTSHIIIKQITLVPSNLRKNGVAYFNTGSYSLHDMISDHKEFVMTEIVNSPSYYP